MYYNNNFVSKNKKDFKIKKMKIDNIKKITTRIKKLKIILDLNLHIELLDKKHEFTCKTLNFGKEEFNLFLNYDAYNNMTSGDGVTYVVTNILNGKENIIAYFQLSAFALHFKDEFDFEDDKVPKKKKKTRYIPINSFLINMFAVDKKYQDSVCNGMIVSDIIFKYIIAFIEEMSKTTIGGKIIILCSVKDAISFYKRNNFKPLNEYMTLFDKYIDGEKPMYLGLYDLPLLEH